jgi:hypothetical protein
LQAQPAIDIGTIATAAIRMALLLSAVPTPQIPVAACRHGPCARARKVPRFKKRGGFAAPRNRFQSTLTRFFKRCNRCFSPANLNIDLRRC